MDASSVNMSEKYHGITLDKFEEYPVLSLVNSLFIYLLEDATFIGRATYSVRKTWKDKLFGNTKKTEIYEGYTYLFNKKHEIVSPPIPVDYLVEYDPENRKHGAISIYKENNEWIIQRESDSLALYVNGRKFDGKTKLRGKNVIERFNDWTRRYEPLGEIYFKDIYDLRDGGVKSIPITEELKRKLERDLKSIDERISNMEEKIWYGRTETFMVTTRNWLSPFYSPNPHFRYMNDKDYFLTLKWAIENSLEKGKIEGNAKLVLDKAKCPYLHSS